MAVEAARLNTAVPVYALHSKSRASRGQSLDGSGLAQQLNYFFWLDNGHYYLFYH